MAQLHLTTTSAFARTGSSQSNLGTATVLAFKMRCSGEFLLSGPTSPSFSLPVRVDNNGTTSRINLYLYEDATNVSVGIGNGSGSTLALAVIPIADIDSGAMYIVYGHASAGGWVTDAYEDDGTLVNSGSAAGVAIPSNAAGNGFVRLGTTAVTGVVGLIDGLAFYSATLAGANRYSAPSASDANILWYVPFDEGTGTSAANVVPGATAITSWGAAWQSGGTWDGPTPPSSTQPPRTMHQFRMAA